MRLNPIIFCIFILTLFINGCGNESGTTGPSMLENVKGHVTYLDGSDVAKLNIQFLNITTKRSYSTTTDASGNFNVSNLSEGIYELSTQGTSSLVYKYIDTVDVNINNSEFDFIFKYRYIDDQIFIAVNDDLSFIKFNTFDTKIGSAFDSINYVAGYYQGDFANEYTLSAEIYEIPAGVNWTELAEIADADYIRTNYTKLITLEEIFVSQSHVLIFRDDALNVLYSNPSNGFAFVNADTTKILKLPCIDRQNNDIALEIYYK